jgi:hypothetical protein
MAALVNIAIFRYVVPKVEPDVSVAVGRLLGVDVASQLHPSTTVDRNAFLAQFAYTAEVNAVLKWHEFSLRHLFNGLAKLDHPTPGTSLSSSSSKADALITLTSWIKFLNALGIIGTDVSDRDATLCFVWSRMAVVDNRTARGSLKETHLPFEGFCEALCRLAALKALPTDGEIQEAGQYHAGTYLKWLALEDAGAYEALLSERGGSFGQPARPIQPIDRMVAHVVEMVLYEIELQTGSDGSGNLELTQSEIAKWKALHFRTAK